MTIRYDNADVQGNVIAAFPSSTILDSCDESRSVAAVHSHMFYILFISTFGDLHVLTIIKNNDYMFNVSKT